MNVKYEYKEMVADGAKLFWEKKLTPGMDSGDLSFRDKETGYIYICPQPAENFEIMNWGVLKPENICVIDIEGNLVEDIGLLPTVEAPMHLEIYKARPEINAIVHSHPIWSSAYAVTGKNIPLTLAEQALFLGGEVICAEYGVVASDALAKNIVNALGKNKKAALMRNHGSVTIGTSLTEAFVLADFLEHAAQVAIMGSVLGKLIVVDENNILDPSLLEE